MRLATVLIALLVCTSGCAYKNHYTFSGTRKLNDSRVPPITKACFSPFVAMGETLWSPITAYIDAREHARTNDHVYLSFVGSKTLLSVPMHPGYKVAGGILVGLIDLTWFPVAGTVDTVYVLTRPEPDRDA